MSAALDSPPIPLALRLRRVLSTRISWLVLFALVATVLGIGSVHRASSSNADRIANLESILKRPPCDDISIAQSNDVQAKALRVSVAQWVNEGWSDSRIENTVVAEYGADEILTPAKHGIDAVVWIVPLVVVIVGALALLFTVIGRSKLPASDRDRELDEMLVQSARRRREDEQ